MDGINVLAEFEEIDNDCNGFITRSEMEAFVRKKGMDPEYVDKWFEWFDFEGSGRITAEEVCTTLGIGMRKPYQEKVERKRATIREGKRPLPANEPPQYAAPPTKNLEGVEILHEEDVNYDILHVVVALLRQNESKYTQDSSLAKYLMEELEKQFGRHWQVVVASDTIACAVGHEERYFLHFSYNKRLFIMYRTID